MQRRPEPSAKLQVYIPQSLRNDVEAAAEKRWADIEQVRHADAQCRPERRRGREAMISDKKSPPFKIELNNCGVPVIVPVGDRTPAEARAWAIKVAGLAPSEIREDREQGWLISGSGIRKLAALAPDTGQKLEFLAWLQEEFPQTPPPIKGPRGT